MKYKEFMEKWAKEHGQEEKIKDILPFIESLDKRTELFETLQSDARMANETLNKNMTNQYLRRTVVRTTFATIEGLLNVLGQNILDAHKNRQILLTADEIGTIEEKGKNGRPNFLSIDEKMVILFKIFAQKFGGFEFNIDKNTKEWDQFKNAIKIRNRLMHPRHIEDLTISTQQLTSIISTSTWFHRIHSNLLNQSNEIGRKKIIEDLLRARIKGIQTRK